MLLQFWLKQTLLYFVVFGSKLITRLIEMLLLQEKAFHFKRAWLDALLVEKVID